jgi:uncharacterized membrane protein YhaH (DUF805 family)
MNTEIVNPYAAPTSDLGNVGDMNWFEIYFQVLKRYALFRGRATRTEYWVFWFMSTLVSIVLGIVGFATHVNDIPGNIYSLAVLIPGLAVGARRMHDTDRSGWWLLLPLANLYFLIQPSQDAANRFGPRPEHTASDATVEKYLLPVGRSGWAVAAGYLGLFSVLMVPAPLALICGAMALRDIAKNPEKMGKPRAIFGIIMGILGTGLLAFAMLNRH